MNASERVFRRWGVFFCVGLFSVFAVACARRATIPEIERLEAVVPGMPQAWELLMPNQSDRAAWSESDRVKWAYLLYRHITFLNPTNALAHYELGLLLKDRLNQPAMAICAFETYRFLRPTADKARKAEWLIQEALPAAKLQEIQYVFTNYTNEQRIDELEAEHKRLLDRIESVTDRLLAAENALETSTNKVSVSLTPAPTPQTDSRPAAGENALTPSPDLGIPEAPGVGEDSQNIAPKIQTPSLASPEEVLAYHKVVVGDSLWKLAEKYYGDPDALGLIFEANKTKLRSPKILPKGMTLTIPVRRQVADIKVDRLVAQKPFYAVPSEYTLIKVAEQVCGFPEAWQRIYEANRKLLDSKGITLGDQVLPASLELVIPNLPALPRFEETLEERR